MFIVLKVVRENNWDDLNNVMILRRSFWIFNGTGIHRYNVIVKKRNTNHQLEIKNFNLLNKMVSFHWKMYFRYILRLYDKNVVIKLIQLKRNTLSCLFTWTIFYWSPFIRLGSKWRRLQRTYRFFAAEIK